MRVDLRRIKGEDTIMLYPKTARGAAWLVDAIGERDDSVRYGVVLPKYTARQVCMEAIADGLTVR